MPTVNIVLDNKTALLLEKVKGRGENLERACTRILKDIAAAPRPDDGVATYRAMMVPSWFHGLGLCYDKDLAIRVFGEEKLKSNTAGISNMRNLVGITSFRRQGKPRKFTPSKRMADWEIMKQGTFNTTAITTALGFNNSKEALEWAIE